MQQARISQLTTDLQEESSTIKKNFSIHFENIK